MELIDHQTFVNYMQYRDLSVRGLADLVGCSHSTVGHLRSGFRKNCRSDLAKKIEKVLDVPPNSLFAMPKPSTVSRDSGRKVAA